MRLREERRLEEARGVRISVKTAITVAYSLPGHGMQRQAVTLNQAITRGQAPFLNEQATPLAKIW